MRFISGWILIWTLADMRALWLLGLIRRRGLWVMGSIGAFAELLALPHLLWGWQVHQHLSTLPLQVITNLLAVIIPCIFATTLLACAWLAVRRVGRLLRRPRPIPSLNPGRRELLTRALVGAPLAGVAVAAPAGVANSWSDVERRTIRLRTPSLPPDLEGLRILQISDLHLGPVLDVPWLKRALESVATDLDLVAITGDLSDDTRMLKPALELICAVPSRLGHFIIAGNHEHYVGIEQFRAGLDGFPVHLLDNRAVTLVKGTTTFSLAGIDYPARKRVPQEVQFTEMLDATLPQVPPNQFHILLSHHPDVFDQAAARRVPVTLSGHTHGGQVSVLGLALVDLVVRYSRGVYEQGESRLYVTTGLGHWFPFRIDCPTELPVIELIKA
jgi:predicted MPP superfamily phosphohydrolase